VTAAAKPACGLPLTVNGRLQTVPARPGDLLLDVLRDQLGLHGTKRGCSRGECGACTVLVRGRPVMSCITLAAEVNEVETIEGLADESLPLRQAFADEGAFQCGFCTPGQIVRGVAMLRAGVPADEAELRRDISGNLCRCTGYVGIVRALQRTAAAAEQL
jgi:aerobic-type carbon monoxide dehydrogenase small subunit (CoxS/CutS family)